MPRSGGEADKFGNLFEAVWTVHAVLDVFDGVFKAITVEPLAEEAQGIEFYVECNDGSRQFHSVKRQKQGGDWSVADLCRPDSATGRSVLGDLFDRSLSDCSVETCFVSSTGANRLRELSERASTLSNVSEFRRSLSAELQPQFDNRIVPVCTDDENRAFTFLKSLKVILHSHQHLIDSVERRIAGMFYYSNRSKLDSGDLRRAIAEYVMGHLATRMDSGQVREYLQRRGIGSRDWKTDRVIAREVSRINTNYVTMIETELINSAYITREIIDDIISGLEDSNSKGALIVAPGGFGKSCVIAQCISRLSARRTPFMTLRMDAFTRCITARQLGEQLDLPESPAVVLAGIADNAVSVLVVDQLDAMSLVSGRHPDMWMAFNDLCNDVQSYPHMKMILACRDFDLEHDHRLRPLAELDSSFSKYTLGKLSKGEIMGSLTGAGIGDFEPSERQLDILGVPFHLLLFLQGQPGMGFGSVGQLYSAYWERKRRNLRGRLGRMPHWNDVVDALTERMSAEQVLFAPKTLVDDWIEDAQAMVSEHVLVDMDDKRQYRFFHESFFDYAYARRFASADRRVVDFLRSTEQHLFRRSQVRQILDYRREHDFGRYLADVRDIFESEEVRFHIKRMVASGFSRIERPRVPEWQLLEPHLLCGPLSRYVLGALDSHSGRFDLLNSNRVFRRWLASGDTVRIDTSIGYLQSPDLQDVRSSEIAALIRPYAHLDAAWRARIVRVMSWGRMHKSSEMRLVHVDLIASGAYDDYSGTTANKDFWRQYYDAEKERPTFVIDVLRTWFERSVARFDDHKSWSFLDGYVQNRSYTGAKIVQSVARSEPRYYVERMLPVVTDTILNTGHNQDDMLNRLWPSLSNVGNPRSIDDAILLALRKALQHLATHDVGAFRAHVTPVLSYPHQTFGYLTLRSWQDNPQEFADDSVQYLVEDPRRLSIGYGSWVGQGTGTGHCVIARGAIAAVSPACSDDLFAELESAILWYRDDYEMSHPKLRGHTEFLLLRALDGSRMSDNAKRRIRELERKFTDNEDAVVDEDVTLQMSRVGSPIPKENAHIMTDDQWISAMRKHSGSSESRRGAGPHELSRILTELARMNRCRFALLASRMTDDVDATYFSAILDGLGGRFVNGDSHRKADRSTMGEVATDVFLDVIDRVHSLPERPCGSAILHCIEVLADRDLPLRTLEAVSYYAMHDPDPDEDIWRNDTGGESRYYGGDPYQHGINCVRGQAGEAIATLLDSNQTRLAALRGALEALSQDRIVSVRTCAVDALLPLLNFSRDFAVKLFVAACSGRREMWRTHPFERFVHYAVHTHYDRLRPVLQAVLRSGDEGAADRVARQIALAELNDVDVGSDGEQVRTGSAAMRKAVAGIYARNVAKEVVGAACMKRLGSFLDDTDETVRSEVSTAFFDVSDEWLLRSREFVLRFIESKAFESGPYDVLRVLEESNLAVPDVICRAAERVLGFLGEEGTHVAYHGSMVAKSIATLVVRQYQQAADASLRRRCLDLIDQMQELGYFGIDSELAKLER